MHLQAQLGEVVDRPLRCNNGVVPPKTSAFKFVFQVLEAPSSARRGDRSYQ
jgi:hypothetical protein